MPIGAEIVRRSKSVRMVLPPVLLTRVGFHLSVIPAKAGIHVLCARFEHDRSSLRQDALLFSRIRYQPVLIAFRI